MILSRGQTFIALFGTAFGRLSEPRNGPAHAVGLPASSALMFTMLINIFSKAPNLRARTRAPFAPSFENPLFQALWLAAKGAEGSAPFATRLPTPSPPSRNSR